MIRTEKRSENHICSPPLERSPVLKLKVVSALHLFSSSKSYFVKCCVLIIEIPLCKTNGSLFFFFLLLSDLLVSSGHLLMINFENLRLVTSFI
mmetsp:Transcript_338/g.471  ORF Transcript_338/g.471 Transcript_338/m.471 type:complete len:93 (+) Transcript_338:144-422(+)